jgi:hypothetical protein
MSSFGPNVFVNIGDSDYLSLVHRYVDFATDSRLRGSKRVYNTGAWRSYCASGLRTATNTRRYAEFVIVNVQATDAQFIGLVLEGAETAATATFLGNVAGTCGYRASSGGATAEIRLNTSGVVQSGLATYTTGDVVGVEYYAVSGVPRVQFYKNGVAVGTAVTLTSGKYRLAASTYVVGNETFLNVDRDDLQYLPSGSQPWGSSARVSDWSGYSPAASYFNTSRVSSAGLVVDAYLKTVTAAADSTWRGIGVSRSYTPSTSRRLRYFEVLLETAGNSTHAGLQIVSPASMGTYVGSTANSWGLSSATGNTWHTAAAIATGAIVAGAGDRIGVLWDGVSSVWFYVNGVLVGGGDPENNTGARYTDVTAEVHPCVSQLGTATQGRARYCGHACEMRYKPIFAEAWDGADILPEQFYENRLANDAEISSEVWFDMPWGENGSLGTPIGAIELINTDGRFDPCKRWNNRDGDLAIYEIFDNCPVHVARANVDSFDLSNPAICRVVARGKDSFLDKRIENDAFALGKIAYIPAKSVSQTDLSYNVDQTVLTEFSLFDKGVEILDHKFITAPVTGTNFRGTALNIQRTVDPAGKLSFGNVQVYSYVTAEQGTNWTFTTLSGANPASFTVVESGTASQVIANGSTCRFYREAAGTECSIAQAAGLPYPLSPSSDVWFLEIVISAWVSGTLQIDFGSGLLDVPQIKSVGTFYVQVTNTSQNLKIGAKASSDFTIDSLRRIRARPTWFGSGYIPELLTGYGNVPTTAYESFFGTTEPSSVGFWSDQKPTLRQALDAAMQAFGCGYYTRPDGVLAWAKWELPEDADSVVATLDDTTAHSQLGVSDDLMSGLSSDVFVNLNYALHGDGDVAAGAFYVQKSELKQPGYLAKLSYYGTSGPLDPFYDSLNNKEPIKCFGYYDFFVGTPYEIVKLSTWAAKKRFDYKREYPFSEVRNIKPGQVVLLKSSRHEASAGIPATVQKITRRLLAPTAVIYAKG